MLSVHASVVIMRRTNELSQITRRTAKNAAEKWSVWSGSDKKKNRENEYDDSSISFDGWGEMIMARNVRRQPIAPSFRRHRSQARRES